MSGALVSLKIKETASPQGACCFFGAPAGTRTPDTLLKRQVLYLLSYWGIFRQLLMRRKRRIKSWLGWRDSNPLYRSQSPVCYHYTTSQNAICKKAGAAGLFALWGGIWGSNPRHPEPQSGALPTELIPPNTIFSLFPRFTKSKPSEAGLILRRTSSGASELSSPRGSETMRSLRGRVGTPRGIRTPDLLLRRQLLYPAELLAHKRLTKAQRAPSGWSG